MTKKTGSKKKAVLVKKPKKAVNGTEMVRLDSLKPNSANPRFIDKAAFAVLKQSIERDPEFMEFRPLVYDADRTILGGNQRWRALKDLGKEEIPASWVKDGSKLTVTQKRRFVLVDNSPKGMAGEWDYEILGNEYGMDELEMVGFSESDLGIKAHDDNDTKEKGDPGEQECPQCGFRF